MKKPDRTVHGFARLADLSAKRIIDIEKMPTPVILEDSTMAGLARALGYPTVGALEEAWCKVESPRPKLKDTRKRDVVSVKMSRKTHAGLMAWAEYHESTLDEMLAKVANTHATTSARSKRQQTAARTVRKSTAQEAAR